MSFSLQIIQFLQLCLQQLTKEQIQILQNNNYDNNTIQQFNEFTIKFQKQYQNNQNLINAFKNFEYNLNQLKYVQNQCSTCSINGLFDIDFNTLTSLVKRQQHSNKQQSSEGCLVDEYCSAQQNPQINTTDFYESIDLVEQNLIQEYKVSQGNCGSCFAIIATHVAANVILNDQAYIKQLNKQTWINNSKDINVSTQFILSNAIGGGNDYCQGGDTGTALNYISNIESTLETAYDYKYEPDQHIKGNRLTPKLSKDQYYMPFKMFTSNYSNDEIVPTINIYNDFDLTQPFGQDQIDEIKSYISRGYAIVIQLVLPYNRTTFNTYNGGIIEGYDCDQLDSKIINHQALIVGYGKIKQGDQYYESWKVLNSWGGNWSPSTSGYFFLRTDQNQFCMNYWADVYVGQGFEDQKVQLNMENRGLGGQWFEKDNPDDNQQEEQVKNDDLTDLEIAGITLGSLGGVIIIVSIVYYINKKKRQQDPYGVYLLEI